MELFKKFGKRYFNKFWGNKKADYYVVFNKETLRRLKK